jgi:predicted ATPase
VPLTPFTVLFGPNAAGKSNFLDAIQVLSRLASERTLADALGEPLRGRSLEAFLLPPKGLPGLLSTPKTSFEIQAKLSTKSGEFNYLAEVAIKPDSGALTVENEYLANLAKSGEQKGEALIERGEGSVLRVRRRRKAARPREEKVGLGYTLLSDERYTGDNYQGFDRARQELSSWRTYYLDPRIAMRVPQAPQEVADIGPLGEHIAPFLYRMRSEQPRLFGTVRRTLRTLIPSVEDLQVDLDTRRGVLDVEVVQDGVAFSSRIVSEGTLRVLALVCIAVNPWGGSLAAFEEPENGVHPRRIELIAEMLLSLATRDDQPRQVIVTTHSPLFCQAVIRLVQRMDLGEDQVALFQVGRRNHSTQLTPFQAAGPLFHSSELSKGLSDQSEDGRFEALVLRGLLDG